MSFWKRLTNKKKHNEPQYTIPNAEKDEDDISLVDFSQRSSEYSNALDIGSCSIRWMKSLLAKGSTWKSKVSLLIQHDLLVLGNDPNISLDTQMYIYDTRSMKWTGSELNGQGPDPCDYYVGEVSKLQERLFLFWANQKMNVSILNFMANMQWDQPECQGNPPICASGYSATRVGDKIYIFGGKSLADDYLSDLYSLHEDHFTWKKEKQTKEVPTPREGHSATVINGHEIFLFGGKAGFDYLNDGYILNTKTMVWKKITMGGKLPDARSQHSMTLYHHPKLNKDVLVLFGGQAGGRIFNSVDVLDLESMIWYQVQTFGDPPTGRYGHFCGNVPNAPFVIFGGRDAKETFFDIYNLKIENISRQAPKVDPKLRESQPTQTQPAPGGPTTKPGPLENSVLAQRIDEIQNQGRLEDDEDRKIGQQIRDARGRQATNSDPLLSTNRGLLDYFDEMSGADDLTPQQDGPSQPSHKPSEPGHQSTDAKHPPQQMNSPPSQPRLQFSDQHQHEPQNDYSYNPSDHGTSNQGHNNQGHNNQGHNNQGDHHQNDEDDDEFSPQDFTDNQLSKSRLFVDTTPASKQHQTPVRNSEGIRPPLRRAPQLGDAGRSRSFSNRQILELLDQEASEQIPSSPGSMNSSRVGSPSMLSHSPTGHRKSFRMNSPVPKSSMAPNYYGDQTPPRSGTPTSVVEDDEEQSAQLFETFDNLSKLVQDRNLKKHTSRRKIDGDNKGEDAYEFSIGFDSHVFNASHEEKDLTDFVSSEQNLVQEIFDYLAEEEDDELVLTLTQLLKTCRLCGILDNAITWQKVIIYVKEATGSDDTIQGDEFLTLDEFRRVLMKIAVTKFTGVISESSVICFRHLLEHYLKDKYETTKGNEDEEDYATPKKGVSFISQKDTRPPPDLHLDEIISAEGLCLFLKYDKKLKELFSLFSTLSLHSSHQPGWSAVVKSKSTISIPECLQLGENFDIVPHLIPRHLFCKFASMAISTPSKQKEDPKLSYPEFVEAFFRIALYIYSRYPYSKTLTTLTDKVTTLFTTMGFHNRKKFNSFVKSSGIGIRNKYKYKSKKQVKPKKELDKIIQNPETLRSTLAHIFMYYCTFGDPLSKEQMSVQKFSKFVKDIKVEKFVNREQSELIYVQLMKNRETRIGKDAHKHHHRMTLPYFVEALNVIASRVYHDLPPKKSLYSLLQEYVLPYASHEPHKFADMNYMDPKVQDLFTTYRKQFLGLFHAYCTRDTLETHNFGYLTIDHFTQMCSHFDITPGLVHRKDLHRIFRSALLHTTVEDIDYQQFEVCFAKVAYLAYSKYPYDVKFKTLESKIFGLIQKIGINDWILLRKKLQKLGHKVPLSPAKVYKTHSSGKITSYKYKQPKKLEMLPPEEELDYELRCIFQYYREYGHKYGKLHLGSQQYLKFCKDSNLLDLHFGQVDADLVYIEITKNDQNHMTYELFCDSLTLVAERKYYKDETTTALRKLLLYNVLSYAQRKQLKENILNRAVEPAALLLIHQNETPIRRIFDTYKRLEMVRGSNQAEVHLNDQTMSVAEFIRFTQDFNICPAILSISEVTDLFNLSCYCPDNQDQDNLVLTFDKFQDCLARIAITGYSKKHYQELYPTAHQKTVVLFQRMEIDSSIALVNKLRTVAAHSLIRSK